MFTGSGILVVKYGFSLGNSPNLQEGRAIHDGRFKITE